jgi:uncharacterized protein YeeX (DUF496 family)
VTAELTLLREIEESKTSLDREREDGIYKRDLKKRVELLSWVLEKMKDPSINICALIESRMNNIIDKINEMDSIIECDPLDSELRILDYILYVVCSNENSNGVHHR